MGQKNFMSEDVSFNLVMNIGFQLISNITVIFLEVDSHHR